MPVLTKVEFEKLVAKYKAPTHAKLTAIINAIPEFHNANNPTKQLAALNKLLQKFKDYSPIFNASPYRKTDEGLDFLQHGLKKLQDGAKEALKSIQDALADLETTKSAGKVTPEEEAKRKKFLVVLAAEKKKAEGYTLAGVLGNAALLAQFLGYTEKERNSEQLEFLIAMRKPHTAKAIFEEFIEPGSRKDANISSGEKAPLIKIAQEARELEKDRDPAAAKKAEDKWAEMNFDTAVAAMTRFVENDPFQRWKKDKLSKLKPYWER